MNWTNLTAVETAPANTLVTLEQAKAHLRLGELEADDDLIEGLIETAVSSIQGGNGIGVALLTGTYRLSLNAFPTDHIMVPLGPVQSVESITYVDAAGVSQTLDPATYAYDLDAQPLRIHRMPGTSWPATLAVPGVVKVTVTAGYGNAAADVPADLRHAALLLIEKHYDPDTDNERAIEAILSRYRVLSFG